MFYPVGVWLLRFTCLSLSLSHKRRIILPHARTHTHTHTHTRRVSVWEGIYLWNMHYSLWSDYFILNLISYLLISTNPIFYNKKMHTVHIFIIATYITFINGIKKSISFKTFKAYVVNQTKNLKTMISLKRNRWRYKYRLSFLFNIWKQCHSPTTRQRSVAHFPFPICLVLRRRCNLCVIFSIFSIRILHNECRCWLHVWSGSNAVSKHAATKGKIYEIHEKV